MEAPDNALSALRLMPSKGSEIANFSYQIIKAVREGHANPLEVLIMLKSLEAVSELVRDEIEQNVLTESEKHPEKKFEAFGATVEKAEVYTRYNFNKCADPTYERLEVDFNLAKQRLDERKEFLKTLREPIALLVEETGEVTTINPPLKTSKSGVKVFLKSK